MTKRLNQVHSNQKLCAFTFDDGPDPLYTTQLLEIFRQYDAKSTFFVVGQALEKQWNVARAIHEEGHEIGNHTYSHPYLTKVDKEQQFIELERTEKLIVDITGVKPRCFRPPFLDDNEDVDILIERFNYVSIGGINMNTNDWAKPGVNHIVNTIHPHIATGSIILLHDAGGDRSQTVEAVRILLPEILEQGYQLITVSNLLELTN